MQCFKITSDEIEGRLDAEFYKPEYLKLEKKIKKLTTKTLGDYIVSISSGATPNKDEADKYYTELPQDGVPFLRVQNVTQEGLDFDNIKYINFETHNGMLKRSQVKEGDLLTKITGVGRMAISTVAPADFDGNINQHLVVIKTKNKEVSEILATFLNLDIGEKLASRRSTGGTRPALDYVALKSIPIVYKPEMVELVRIACENKKKKDKEAEELLNSIDDFVLEQLDIELPKIDNKMCYKVYSDELYNNRIDPYYYQPKFEKVIEAINNCKYKSVALKNVFNESGLTKGYLPSENEKDGEAKTLQIRNITQEGYINIQNYQTAKEEIFGEHHLIKYKEILIVVTGATIGKIGLWNLHDKFYLGGDIVKFKTNQDFIPEFVQAYLLSPLGQKQIQRNITGATNGHLSTKDIENIRIPLVPKALQTEIAKEIKTRKLLASNLRYEAREELEQAKAKVERIILGEETIG